MTKCRTACVPAVTPRHGACPAAPPAPGQPALLAFAEPAGAGGSDIAFAMTARSTRALAAELRVRARPAPVRTV
jgi:hypothetical protein